MPQYIHNSIPVDDSSEEKLPPILKSEIRTSIKDLKPGKSPGLDNIYSEYVKAGGEPLVNALHILFNHILQIQIHKPALGIGHRP